MGAITPLGNNVKTFWKNIKKGKCGIDFIKAFDTSEFKVKIAAEIKDFNPADILDFKELKRMDKFTQMGVIAANEAVDDARLSNESDSRENWGIILGTGIGGLLLLKKKIEKLSKKGRDAYLLFLSLWLFAILLQQILLLNFCLLYTSDAADEEVCIIFVSSLF